MEIERHIKSGPKKVTFFRPTSDVNISGTVYPIYLKINLLRVAIGDSLDINCVSLSPCLQYSISFGNKKPDNIEGKR